MAEPESLNTLQQNSYVKIADGSSAQQTLAKNYPAPESNINSATDGSSVSAPGAGVTVATTASLPAGTYDVEVMSFISGTTVSSVELLNMRLLGGATAIARILNPVPGTTGSIDLGQLRARVVLASNGTISVVAVAAATAGSVYSASIVAKRVV